MEKGNIKHITEILSEFHNQFPLLTTVKQKKCPVAVVFTHAHVLHLNDLFACWNTSENAVTKIDKSWKKHDSQKQSRIPTNVFVVVAVSTNCFCNFF